MNINSKTCVILNLAIADSIVPIKTEINAVIAKNNAIDRILFKPAGIIKFAISNKSGIIYPYENYL